MGAHFRAFSFVDRILALEAGARIRGSYSIPPDITHFSNSLVAEAVGQLAAWAAMAAVDFRSRPVAGLAASIELLAPVLPGQVLELTAELETVDNEAAAYGGSALVNGSPVIRLQHCVGPMLPVEDFDDPDLLRERFALLRGAGATPGAFGGLPSFPLESLNGGTANCLHATLQVPTAAPFFADHFPRRPVFPGSLLMHSNLELAATLAARLAPPAAGGGWTLCGLSDVKLRAFTPPGEQLEIEACLSQLSAGAALLDVETRKGKRVISGARVRLTPEKTS
jgi:3-hydroxymyristoyl/3-hydroxydecanoyl-(acyl carrier protein) dehydratase